MTFTEVGYIELHEEDIKVDADIIELVYSSMPFEREHVVCKGRKLTDKVNLVALYVKQNLTYVANLSQSRHSYTHTPL